MLHVYNSPFTGNYTCEKCDRSFKLKCHLVHHMNHCGKQEKLICELCGKYETTRSNNLKKHRLVCLKRITHGMFDDDVNLGASCSNSSRVSGSSKDFTCDICRRPHGNMAELIEHRNVHSNVPTGMLITVSNDFGSINLSKHSFGNHVCEYDLTPHEPCSGVLRFFKCPQS